MMMQPNATVFDPKMALSWCKTLYRGFNKYFAVPEHQKDTVDHYSNEDFDLAHTPISANGLFYVRCCRT